MLLRLRGYADFWPHGKKHNTSARLFGELGGNLFQCEPNPFHRTFAGTSPRRSLLAALPSLLLPTSVTNGTEYRQTACWHGARGHRQVFRSNWLRAKGYALLPERTRCDAVGVEAHQLFAIHTPVSSTLPFVDL